MSCLICLLKWDGKAQRHDNTEEQHCASLNYDSPGFRYTFATFFKARLKRKQQGIKMNTLTQLHADIEARVKTIRDGHPDWLCRMGCDGCCRRLAEVPRLTAVEWDWLRAGLTALPPEQLLVIGQNIAELSRQYSRPVICPLLGRSAGVCQVYAHRPVACRTYGFYVQRDGGLYCKDIESQVANGIWPDVAWGNQDAIDRHLCGLGETRELTDRVVHVAGEERGYGLKTRVLMILIVHTHLSIQQYARIVKIG
jgi:Fe-S-cluster containining protein